MILDMLNWIINRFYPGSMDQIQWETFGQHMLTVAVLAAALGFVVFAVGAWSLRIRTSGEVMDIPRPYRRGIVTIFVLVFIAAALIIIVKFRDQPNILSFPTLLFVLFCALLGWLLYSLISTWYCQRSHMSRFRFVTFLSRRMNGGRA